MAAITPLPPVSPPGSATSRQKGSGPGEDSRQPGQLLEALVLEIKGANRFLLEISGQTVTAESATPLIPGQKLQLEVVSTTPQIELKIVPDTLNQVVANSLTLPNKNIDLTELFQALNQQPEPPINLLSAATKNVLEEFHLLQKEVLSGNNDGTVIKNLIDRLGLHLENSLAGRDLKSAGDSLKAALLEITEIFPTDAPVKESSARLLTVIELFQMALLNNSSERQVIFPLPLPFLQQGYLVVTYDRNSRSTDSDNQAADKFSLHLAMAELGNIQIDFFQLRDTLSIHFRADSQEKADFISLFSEQLQNSLSAASRINITFSGDAVDPMTDLINHIVRDGDSLINTRI
jgi:hypothetical protein